MDLAVAFPKNRDGVQSVTEMLARMPGKGGETRVFAIGSGGAVGYRLAAVDSRLRMVVERNDGGLVLIAGVPVSVDGSLARVLEACRSSGRGEIVPLLTGLDGTFVALFWDELAARLHIISDFLGMEPFYHCQHDGGFHAASTIRAVVVGRQCPAVPDPVGWGAFMTMGHLVGDRTMVEGVRRLEPGAVTTVDPTAATIATRSYWHWSRQATVSDLAEPPTAPVVEALERSIAGLAEHGRMGTLLLSGGFDSRLVGCLLKKAGIEFSALIVSNPEERDDVDGTFGAMVARALGVKFRKVPADRHFFDYFSSPDYLAYLELSEITTPSLYLFITCVFRYLVPEMQAVWEGVAPGCSLTFLPYQPKGGFQDYLDRNWDSGILDSAGRIFDARFLNSVRCDLSTYLDEELRRYPDDSLGVAEFIVRNRTRNRTAANPLKVCKNRVMPYCPGFTREYWEIVESLAPENRRGHRMYKNVFLQHFPKTRDVPFSSAGKIVELDKRGRLSLYFASLRSGVKGNVYVTRPITRRLGIRPRNWSPSAFLEGVPSEEDLESPYIDADFVRALDRSALNEQDRARAKALLFYWNRWQRHFST